MSKNWKNWEEINSYEDLSDNKKAFCDYLATPEPMRKKEWDGITTQTALAKKLGVSRETLSRWKYKKTFIEIVRVRKKEIAGGDALNKVVDSLLSRASSSRDDANEAAELFMNWFYNEDFTKGDTVKQYNQPNYAKHAAEIAEHFEENNRESSEGEG